MNIFWKVSQTSNFFEQVSSYAQLYLKWYKYLEWRYVELYKMIWYDIK